MPKSSIERRDARCRASRLQDVETARSGRPSSALSVISSSSRSAGTPRLASSAPTRSGSRRRAGCARRGSPPRHGRARCSSHCAHSAQRGRSTNSVSGLIRPVLLGQRDELVRAGRSPRSGCCQRTSASTPTTLAAAEAHLRLVVQDQLVRARAPARSSPTSAEPLGGCRCRARARRPRARPRLRLAWYIATSARCEQASRRRRRGPGSSAMPMLASTCERRRPSSANGSVERRPQRGRPPRRRRRSSTLGRTIANSSPPRRATVSPRAARRAAASADLSSGRRRVAERVVDLLEAVEVEQQHRGRDSALAPRDRLRSRRSLNRTRFGSPVSES